MITSLLLSAALADDLDIEIDLGGTDATPITYNGGFTTRSESKVGNDVAVTVTVPVGAATLYCTDTEFIEARVDYALSGMDPASLEAYGKSFKASAWGGTSGGVKISAGTRSSTIKNANITTVVNVPKGAKVSITASGDWLKVVGCDGTVTGTAKTSAYVGGPLDGFNVTANGGNVVVEVEGDGKLLSNSAISAPKGDITLTMPFSQDLKLDARGTTVTVAHTVSGTIDTAVVTGTLGTGGPTLTIKASGVVDVKTP